MGLKRGSLGLVRIIEELLEWKSSGSDLSENLVAPGIEPGTSESVTRNSDH
jgi:hypothetical protein